MSISIALIIIGALLAFVGGIMGIVAAFRCSIGWGLATLLLPFANLVFLVVHWAEARKGFLIGLAGAGVIALGIGTSPAIREMVAQARAFDPAKMQLPTAGFAREQPASGPDLNATIMEQRERIGQLEAKFAADGNALVEQFKKLTEQRAKLKSGDAAAVTTFNAQAASYQASNSARQQAKQELDAMRAELETLVAQRSRQNAAPAAAKKVVMYSTAQCPACKMAKAYFAKKGVPYEEHDVNSSPEARAAFQKLGGRGVPLILVGTERMEGFSEQRLDQLL